MHQESTNCLKDIQGIGRVTVDAVVGITDIVESMHQAIASAGGILGRSDQTRTRGITGMVYHTVRTVTELAGKGLDIPLSRLGSLISAGEFSPVREAVLSAVNGVLGDYLEENNNPLAVPMRFRRAGKTLNHSEISDIIQQSKGKVVVLVHGLCMNDLQWARKGYDYGDALYRDLGIMPIYLNYNTGRHISENGREFSDLMEAFLAPSHQSIELAIIAHSMGGLVSRSACCYAKRSGHTWVKNVKKMVFLGTPHHGALLEKGGNWLENILKISPYSRPFSRLGKIRSAGVLDLRYGNIVDEDWEGKDLHGLLKDQRTPIPLPEKVLCYAVAGTLRKDAGKFGDGLLGDGLVAVNSALGYHRNPQFQLLLPEDHQWVGRGVNHMDLQNSPEVYRVLKQWLAA